MKKKTVRIDVKSIKNPNIVKELNYKSLTFLCHDIRKEIIEATSIYGGHLSSNLGVVELTVALYRHFDFPKDKLIFDVGHQCYTHKILTGRSLKNLNSKDGVSGFIKCNESEYDCFEAGHSSTSISAAEAFAVSRDLKGENYEVVAVIGDSSMANGLSFEALNNLGSRHNKAIIVLNDNDMSISKPVGGMGNFFRRISTARTYNKFKSKYRKLMYKTGFGRRIYSLSYFIKRKIKSFLVPTTMFDNMGFTYIGPIDGHNIKALEKAFSRAQNTTKSVIVHVYTSKGKGYEKAERDATGYWHSATPFDIETGDPINVHPNLISWSHFFGDLIHRSMKDIGNSLLICPAMVKSAHLEESFKDFPSRCFDVGIAEEHALTLAGSFYLNGFHPIVSIYSTFLQRAYDQLLHDCSRINADLTLLIDRAGLVGKNGETHMGIYDEAFLKSIPNVTIAMPSTAAEARALMRLSFEKGNGIFAIRYPRDYIAKSSLSEESPSILKGKWIFLNEYDERRKTIIGVGSKGRELFAKLQKDGFAGNFINPLFLNPIDAESIKKIIKSEEIFAYDPYGTENGFVESLEKCLFESGYSGTFKKFALPNGFIEHDSVANQEETYKVSVSQVSSYIERN